MKSKRLAKYLKNRQSPSPLNKGDIQKNSDKHIDQDFPGYPDAPAKEEVIKPKTGQQKKTAAVDVKDGEKKKPEAGSKVLPSEQDSEGSGGAFNATEEVRE